MEKAYVQKLIQNGRTFYAAVLDPRKVADLLPDIDAGEDQEAQRPWKAKKVKQISKYVAGRMSTPRGEVNTTVGVLTG